MKLLRFADEKPPYFDVYAIIIRRLLIVWKRLPDTYGREGLTEIDGQKKQDIIVGKIGS